MRESTHCCHLPPPGSHEPQHRQQKSEFLAASSIHAEYWLDHHPSGLPAFPSDSPAFPSDSNLFQFAANIFPKPDLLLLHTTPPVNQRRLLTASSVVRTRCTPSTFLAQARLGVLLLWLPSNQTPTVFVTSSDVQVILQPVCRLKLPPEASADTSQSYSNLFTVGNHHLRHRPIWPIMKWADLTPAEQADFIAHCYAVNPDLAQMVFGQQPNVSTIV